MSAMEPISTPPAPAYEATVVIEPRPGWHLVSFRDLWHYRDLAYFLCWRDVKVRYKQTVLGILWAFLQPFVKMVVFSVIFGRLAKIDSGPHPYPLMLYAGLLPWQFFSEAVTRSSQSIVDNERLVTKVFFPRIVIPLSSVAACVLDFAIAFTILGGLMAWYGTAPGCSMLMVLPLTLLTIAAAVGVGAFVSALNVAYRDFRYVIPFLMQIWMFVTPVIYPVDLVSERWRWVLCLNPMGGLVDGWRSAVLGTRFDWTNLGISAGVTIVVLVIGTAYFRRIERLFADIM